MANKAPVATEHMEQVALFEWAERMKRAHPCLRLLHAIPNGAALVAKTTVGANGRKTRLSLQALKLRAEGLKPGVPDVCLPVARGAFHGLYIEMKRRVGGVLSDEQAQWLEDLTAEGYRTARCDGWDQARELILEYLRDDLARRN